MKINLEDIIEVEVNMILALLIQRGDSFQSAKQQMNNLLVNVDPTSDTSVRTFLTKSFELKKSLMG